MGVGVVVHDHTGCFLAACGESHEVVTPEIAEALTVRRALSFAQEEGWPKIIMASDCLSVIQRIRSGGIDRSLCGPVIEDIKLLSMSFTSCVFCHVNRVLNVAAHLLARGCESVVSSVWRYVFFFLRVCVALCCSGLYP